MFTKVQKKIKSFKNLGVLFTGIMTMASFCCLCGILLSLDKYGVAEPELSAHTASQVNAHDGRLWKIRKLMGM
jgi:hypothetical protein